MSEQPTKHTDEEFAGLQTKLTELDTRAKRFEGMATDLEKKLERYKDLDPVEYKANKEALEELRRELAEKGDKNDLKKWRTDTEGKIRSEVQKQIDTLQAERDQLLKEAKELKIVDKAMEKIAAKFNEDGHGFVKDYVRRSVDRDDTGEFIVKDEKGAVRYSASKPAQRLTIEEYAEEIAAKHPSIAKPSVTSGTMKPGEKLSGGAGDPALTRYLKMTPEERSKLPIADRHKLAQAAAKAGLI